MKDLNEYKVYINNQIISIKAHYWKKSYDTPYTYVFYIESTGTYTNDHEVFRTPADCSSIMDITTLNQTDQ